MIEYTPIDNRMLIEQYRTARDMFPIGTTARVYYIKRIEEMENQNF